MTLCNACHKPVDRTAGLYVAVVRSVECMVEGDIVVASAGEISVLHVDCERAALVR